MRKIRARSGVGCGSEFLKFVDDFCGPDVVSDLPVYVCLFAKLGLASAFDGISRDATETTDGGPVVGVPPSKENGCSHGPLTR